VYAARLPALTVTASMNCSLHDDVPTTSDMLAFRNSLSTVLYDEHTNMLIVVCKPTGRELPA